MYIGLIILIIVVGLCIITGIIYLYLYFTQINPRTPGRGRQKSEYTEAAGKVEAGDAGNQGNSNHAMLPFAFRGKNTR